MQIVFIYGILCISVVGACFTITCLKHLKHKIFLKIVGLRCPMKQTPAISGLKSCNFASAYMITLPQCYKFCSVGLIPAIGFILTNVPKIFLQNNSAKCLFKGMKVCDSVSLIISGALIYFCWSSAFNSKLVRIFGLGKLICMKVLTSKTLSQ